MNVNGKKEHEELRILSYKKADVFLILFSLVH